MEPVNSKTRRNPMEPDPIRSDKKKNPIRWSPMGARSDPILSDPIRCRRKFKVCEKVLFLKNNTFLPRLCSQILADQNWTEYITTNNTSFRSYFILFYIIIYFFKVLLPGRKISFTLKKKTMYIYSSTGNSLLSATSGLCAILYFSVRILNRN